MPGGFILIFIVFVILAIFGGIHASRKKKEREAALLQLASELNWVFDPTRNYEHDGRFPQFSVFNSGQSRYAYNTLAGSLTVGDETCLAQMGDYHYTTTSGSGKNRRTTHHQFSYVLVTTPYVAAPQLTIRTEHVFDRLTSFLGFDDIDFESAEFSDKFHVKSSDKRFAYDVIDPRMMEFLLDTTPPTIHFERGCCCVYANRKCWSVSEFRHQVAWLQEFFSRWPKHVVTSLQN